MKKKILAGGLAVLMTLSMAGCSSTGDAAGGSTGENASASGDKVTITVWNKNRHDLEYASAIGYVLTLVLLAVSILYFMELRRQNKEDQHGPN